MDTVEIEVPMHGTEVEEKVRQAVLNIFPDAELDVESGNGHDVIKGFARDDGTFLVKLRDQKIRPTARTIMLKSMSGTGISFHLNKQAAYVGKVNFTDGDTVLGDILVTFNTEEPEALIARLTAFEPQEAVE